MSLFQIDAGEEWGGGQKQTLLLVQEMLCRGLAVRLFVQPGSPLYRKASEASLPVFPVPMKGERGIFTIFRLARDMKRYKCRLVHFQDAHSFAVGSAAARLAKVPMRVISKKNAFPLKETLLSRKKVTKFIDGVIAISQEVKNALVAEGISRDKIAIIPDGIDYSLFENASSSTYLRTAFPFDPDDFLVGVVAGFATTEDNKYFADVVRILKQKAPKIKVIVIGGGSLDIETDKLVMDIPDVDIMFLLGFREDIPQILASLDLFVCLSCGEYMSNFILEAMASRLPVVAIRGAGISEIVMHGKTGLLVPPREAAVLADASIQIYRDRELGKELGRKGYERVHQKFSAKAAASKIIQEYERIAQKRNITL